MSNKMHMSHLLAHYRRSAIDASLLSGSKEQNEAADAVRESYKELRRTPEGRAGIIALMSDKNPAVRGWAAAHSLQWMPDVARQILEVLRDEADFPHSFDAQMTLQEFDNGNLRFDSE
jgi:hypothetical protein